MKRPILLALALALLSLMAVVPAAADAPTEIPWAFDFPGIDPCTGQDLFVSMTGTLRAHFHNGRFLAYMERTITTSPKVYVGRGTTIFNTNGQVDLFAINDILVSQTGDRFRAHYVLLVDLSDLSVIVEQGGVDTCLTR